MPQTEPSQPAATPRRFNWRRLVQYRLRTLLILMAVAALPLGWWSYKAERQRRAVEFLHKSGAWVAYYNGPIQRYFGRTESHFSTASEPTLVHWFYRAHVVWLARPASDSDIEALRALGGTVRVIVGKGTDDLRLRTALPNCKMEQPPVFNMQTMPAVQGSG